MDHRENDTVAVVALPVDHWYYQHHCYIDAMGDGVDCDSRRDDSAVVDHHCETMVLRIGPRSEHRDDISDHSPLVLHSSAVVVVHGKDRTEAHHVMAEGRNRSRRRRHHH